MELRKVQALDLRDPVLASIADATAEYDRRMGAIDRMWDWPVFPAKSEEFIRTGIWPKRSMRNTIKFDIVFNTKKFNDSLKRVGDAIAHLTSLGMNVELADHLRNAKKPWYKRLWPASH